MWSYTIETCTRLSRRDILLQRCSLLLLDLMSLITMVLHEVLKARTVVLSKTISFLFVLPFVWFQGMSVLIYHFPSSTE